MKFEAETQGIPMLHCNACIITIVISFFKDMILDQISVSFACS
jgi:hypothetical protein